MYVQVLRTERSPSGELGSQTLWVVLANDHSAVEVNAPETLKFPEKHPEKLLPHKRLSGRRKSTEVVVLPVEPETQTIASHVTDPDAS